MSDGDTLFALGTGAAGKSLGMMTLGAMAAEATARAVVRAVRAAQGISVGELWLPAIADLDRA
jgi:L-aminopeptidase/D-esterase-like protein